MEEKINQPNKRKEYTRLIITLVVLVLIVGTFILYLSWPLLVGKTVVLATRPVDPFDILRGQYITIGYEISSIPVVSGAKQGDTVYVSIKPDSEGIWRYEAASLSKPDNGDFIKGKITQIQGSQIRLEYGIEQFFFERNAELPNRNITVEAKVDDMGQARIKQLLYNGKPITIKYKNVSLAS